MDTPRWAQILSIAFPTLSREGFQIVAQPSDNYNCIAYAAGDFHNWWDYGYGVSRYWPPHAARSSAIENLVEIFAGLGFERCDDGNPESGYQKVALYEQQGLLKHAAVQQPNGRWRSKMGAGPLIEHHSPESLSDGPYGEVHCIMRRCKRP